MSIDVWLDYGCAIRDLDAFATSMREHQGWNIATSGGWVVAAAVQIVWCRGAGHGSRVVEHIGSVHDYDTELEVPKAAARWRLEIQPAARQCHLVMGNQTDEV